MCAAPSQPEAPLAPSARFPRATSPASFFGLGVFRLVVLLLLVSQMPTLARANIVSGCAPSYDPNKDYFPDKASIDMAEDFVITYHKHYKLVVNERTNETFALYQCGTPAPTGLDSSVKVFPIPFSSVGLTQTVDVTFMEMLGLRTAIKFYESPEYVSSSCLQAMVVAGAVEPFSSNSTIKQEQVDSVNGVFVYNKSPSKPKYISISATSDPGALHRAEWIFFVAAFFNAEENAKIIMDNIVERYACTSALGKSSPTTPKVAWVNYNSYSPGSPYEIYNTQYKQDYTKDLGGVPVAPATPSFSSLDAWKAAMADVDYVIDETYLGDMDDFYSNFGLNANSNFKFIKNKQIWKFDRLQSELGALDWYEGAIPNADAVLQDILSIIKPEVDLKHQRVWFRNIAKGESIVVEDAATCLDYAKPATTRASQCTEQSSGAPIVSPLGAVLLGLVSLVFLPLLA